MTDDAALFETLGRIERAQEALRRRLRRVSRARLLERPASGDWSAMENVRHLIFAEQHHFGPYLERGFRWSSAGVPPPNRTGERRLSPVGADGTASVDELFEAWAKVHGVIRALASGQPGAKMMRSLEGNLRHLEIHAAAIEGLLRG